MRKASGILQGRYGSKSVNRQSTQKKECHDGEALSQRTGNRHCQGCRVCHENGCIHIDRTAGSYSHYSHTGRDALARIGGSSGEGETRQLPEPAEPDRQGFGKLLRRLQPVFPGKLRLWRSRGDRLQVHRLPVERIRPVSGRRGVLYRCASLGSGASRTRARAHHGHRLSRSAREQLCLLRRRTGALHAHTLSREQGQRCRVEFPIGSRGR